MSKEQRALRGAVTKATNDKTNCEDVLARWQALADEVSKETLSVSYANLQKRYDNAMKHLKTYEEREPDSAAKEEEIIEKADLLEDIEAILAQFAAALALIEKQTAASVEVEHRRTMQDQFQQYLVDNHIVPTIAMGAASASTEKNTHIKLPTTDLPVFTGEKLKWLQFWNIFDSAVNKNEKLPVIEKLAYLRNKVKGSAEACVLGVPFTEEGYKLAIANLKERFGDKRSQVEAYFNAVNNLQSPTEEVASLRSFYDQLEVNLQSLVSLGETLDSNTLLVQTIKFKLPESVLFYLEDNMDPEADSELTELRAELGSYIKMKEKIRDAKPVKPDVSVKSDGPGVVPKGQTIQQRNYQRGSKEPRVNQQQGGHQGTVADTKCKFCGGNHQADDCRKCVTVQDRKQMFEKHGLCYICSEAGHARRFCPQKRTYKCVHCQKQGEHHRSLCPKVGGVKPREAAGLVAEGDAAAFVNEVPNVYDEKKASSAALLALGERALLHTAMSVARDATGGLSRPVRVLLDDGNQRSYVSREIAKALGLKAIRHDTIYMQRFGETKLKAVDAEVVQMDLKLQDGSFKTFEFAVTEHISGKVYRSPFDEETTGLLKMFKQSLADSIPERDEEVSLDVSLGGDYWMAIVRGRLVPINEEKTLGLWDTVFGSVLVGTMKSKQKEPAPSKALLSLTEVSPDQVEQLWRLETLGIKPKEITAGSDEEVSEEFERTVQFDGERYQVRWPFKDESAILPDNRGLAFGRLKSIVNRYKDEPELWTKYAEIIDDQLKKGIVEKVDLPSEALGKVHYIAHHPVVTPQKATTKVRIVFDASAKTKSTNPCLNDLLHRGPVILESLPGLLMRFRLQSIAIVADIEKAFLQVGLQSDQRDCCRFLWLKDPTKLTTHDNIQELRFTRVCFGVVSSPFLLGATIQHHLNRVGTPTAEFIKGNTYVDNVVVSLPNVQAAKKFYDDGKRLFASASMNLREWATNSEELSRYIPEGDRYSGTVIKIMGIAWDRIADTLTIAGATQRKLEQVETKRDLLSVQCETFDPLGLMCPVTINARVFFQRILPKYPQKRSNKTSDHWDLRLDPDDLSSWLQLVKQFELDGTITVPRCLNLSNASEFMLLCFTDASSKVYASTVYLHFRNADGTQGARLLFAKARLAPSTTITLPRLELMGVLIGVRTLSFVEKEIRLPISKRILWTDSQCVLHWIKSPRTLTVFVENRIKEIRQSTVEFRYIRSEENPADIATRGLATNALMESSLWWGGPPWVSKQKFEDWPKEVEPITEEGRLAADKELRKTPPFYEAKLLVTEGQKDDPPFGIDITRFSSLSKLLRTTAVCLKFVRRCTHGKMNVPPDITMDDINAARLKWELYVQRSAYSGIIDAIKRNVGNQMAHNLGLRLDESGLLRCHGRLEKSDLQFDEVMPKLLPPKDPFSRLVIQDAHESSLHAGVSQTLATVRSTYWIPQGRKAVQSVLSKCRKCRYFQGPPYRIPEFPALPEARVVQSLPFSHVGIDYFGPIYVKKDGDVKKVWCCLFTCMCIRAVHLELVSDMSAEQFLDALRRFTSRRGKPSLVVTDNAGQFRLVKQLMVSEGIRWQFIPDLAPWMGGFYERMVGTVKRSLRKMIGRDRLTVPQLQTLMTEVEAVVNNRPLVHVAADIESGPTLTPARLLYVEKSQKLGAENVDTTLLEDPEYVERMSNKERLVQAWKRGQAYLQRFWDQWHREYLLSLRERYQSKFKGRSGQIDPKVGDVVVLKEDLSPKTWKLGQITELEISPTDGKCRAVKLKFANGKTARRALRMVYPLEVDT